MDKRATLQAGAPSDVPTLVSQGLADHVLASLPAMKHVAGALPGTGVVAVRLYRLAGVTAEACCPVPG